jgi:hypothetical protein
MPGTVHVCYAVEPTLTIQYTQEPPPWPRIVVLLEQILEMLEKIERK